MERTERFGFDEFRGAAHELVSAGLVAPDQFPGQPGRGKSMATYYRGEPVRQGTNTRQDEHYLQIARAGKTFKVIRGVTEQEQQARRRAHALKEAEAAKPHPRGPSLPDRAPKPALVAYEVQRRLAAIEALCRYSRAAVQLKMGDSSKLARAEEDLTAAVDALVVLRRDMTVVHGADSMAEMMVAAGERAESEYLRCARR